MQVVRQRRQGEGEAAGVEQGGGLAGAEQMQAEGSETAFGAELESALMEVEAPEGKTHRVAQNSGQLYDSDRRFQLNCCRWANLKTLVGRPCDFQVLGGARALAMAAVCCGGTRPRRWRR